MVALLDHVPPVLTRTALVTCQWAAALMAVQVLVTLLLRFIQWRGVYQRTHRLPSAPKLKLLVSDVLGWASYMAPHCFLQAWMSPSWSYSAPNVFFLGIWVMLMTAVTDMNYYWTHRWFHTNKLAFSWLHSKHHAPDGSLDVLSAAYIDPLGGVLETGLTSTLACWLANTLPVAGNFWYFTASVYNVAFLNMIGHSGVNARFKHPLEALILVMNPFCLWYMLTPTRLMPADHELHHRDPRYNMAPFFSFWDDLCGTNGSIPRNIPCSVLFIIAHFSYAVAFYGSVYLFVMNPMQSLTAYILAYMVVSPEVAAAVFNTLGVPQAARYLLGWLMDVYRRDNAITYAAPGQPGSFNCTGADNAPAYIFAWHPTGVISRSALLTFAARGWASPVSGLARVRLAVGSALLRLPIAFSRELLLALGCVPADKATLKQHLESGTSVALAPGGWSEPAHTDGYELLLKSRSGFVSLALETRAALVPVLCLGEQVVASDPQLSQLPGFNEAVNTWASWAMRLKQSWRPVPVHVVFGEAVVAREGEDVQQLHRRYTAALLQLGKQHGVALSIV